MRPPVRVNEPVQPVRRGERKSQHHRPPRRRRHSARLGLANDLGAETVGDDEAGLFGHDFGRHIMGMAK